MVQVFSNRNTRLLLPIPLLPRVRAERLPVCWASEGGCCRNKATPPPLPRICRYFEVVTNRRAHLVANILCRCIVFSSLNTFPRRRWNATHRQHADAGLPVEAAALVRAPFPRGGRRTRAEKAGNGQGRGAIGEAHDATGAAVGCGHRREVR